MTTRLLSRRLALPAIAAIALIVWAAPWRESVTRSTGGLTYASGQLERDLAAGEPSAGTRFLGTASDASGNECRAFVRAELSGVACRDRGGWHLRVMRDGVKIDDPEAVTRNDRELRRALETIAQGASVG